MNLKSLEREAVRRAGRVEKVSGLSGAELAAVVAARFAIVDPEPSQPQPQPVRTDPPVTAEQCAIHFYYPQDVAQ